MLKVILFWKHCIINFVQAVFDGVGTQLFDDETCVEERLNGECSLDNELTRFPDSMVSIPIVFGFCIDLTIF